MSKIVSASSSAARLARSSASSLLDRILSQPHLVDAVQSLSPPALGKLIRAVGLEDAGPIVALASTTQLEALFDELLWASEAPGETERFDAAQLVLWLEVLVDEDVALAARKLAALDEDLVTLALSETLLVIDIEALATRVSHGVADDDLDLLEKELDSHLNQEIEQYRVIARSARGWDALVAVLLELNEQDFSTLERLLARCAALAGDVVEEQGGLYEVLSAIETVEADVAAARDDRREQQGYVSPSDALALLRLVASRPLATWLDDLGRDPITRAHFRASTASGPASVRAAEPQASPLALLMAELDPETLQERAPMKRLPAASDARAPRLLARALEELAAREVGLRDRRALELAYVANVLLAGAGVRSRRLRPLEAAELALALCELGADALHDRTRPGGALDVTVLAAALRAHDLVALFRIGLRRLLEPASLPNAAAARPLAELRALLMRQGLAAPPPKSPSAKRPPRPEP